MTCWLSHRPKTTPLSLPPLSSFPAVVFLFLSFRNTQLSSKSATKNGCLESYIEVVWSYDLWLHYQLIILSLSIFVFFHIQYSFWVLSVSWSVLQLVFHLISFSLVSVFSLSVIVLCFWVQLCKSFLWHFWWLFVLFFLFFTAVCSFVKQSEIGAVLTMWSPVQI